MDGRMEDADPSLDTVAQHIHSPKRRSGYCLLHCPTQQLYLCEERRGEECAVREKNIYRSHSLSSYARDHFAKVLSRLILPS